MVTFFNKSAGKVIFSGISVLFFIHWISLSAFQLIRIMSCHSTFKILAMVHWLLSFCFFSVHLHKKRVRHKDPCQNVFLPDSLTQLTVLNLKLKNEKFWKTPKIIIQKTKISKRRFDQPCVAFKDRVLKNYQYFQMYDF